MSAWGKKGVPGTALGMAFGDYGPFTPKIGSLSAAVAEISVNAKTGVIRVHNYWVAVDPGLVINPDSVRMQVESSVVWSLSCCLKERITMVKGVVQQSNFHEYQIMRMAEVPPIHVDDPRQRRAADHGRRARCSGLRAGGRERIFCPDRQTAAPHAVHAAASAGGAKGTGKSLVRQRRNSGSGSQFVFTYVKTELRP